MAAKTVNSEIFFGAELVAQLPELSGWQPSVSEEISKVDLRTAAMLAAIFNQPPLREGDEVPPAWHWAFFIKPALQREIGADGHPQKGGFLPPVNLPRRMFAGSHIQFQRPLLVGEAYRRLSRIVSIEAKQGQSGKLAFVKVEHVISDTAGIAHIIEEQDLVYREPNGVAKKTTAAPAAVRSWAWTQSIVADPVMLFRYSAVTFNAHRIHYDYPYVTQEEGYPGLVVHGPLLATLMLQLLREKLPGERVATFRFAGKAPVFSGREFYTAGSREDQTVQLAILSDGQTAMTGQATLRLKS